jgi:hypothetical protein
MSFSLDLPVNASSFAVTGFATSNGHKVAILRCNGSWHYFTASADPSGFAAVDFQSRRVFMTESRLDSLSVGDTLHVDFIEGEALFTLEKGGAA